MTPPKKTVSSTKLERELVAARKKVERAEVALEDAKADRDRLAVRYRRSDPTPSARLVGELAGISAVWVLKLAEEAG